MFLSLVAALWRSVSQQIAIPGATQRKDLPGTRCGKRPIARNINKWSELVRFGSRLARMRSLAIMGNGTNLGWSVMLTRERFPRKTPKCAAATRVILGVD